MARGEKNWIGGRLPVSTTLTFRMWKIHENGKKEKLCVCVLLHFGFWFISFESLKIQVLLNNVVVFFLLYNSASSLENIFKIYHHIQRKVNTLAISPPKNNHIWFLVKIRIMLFTLVCNMFVLLSTHTDSIFNSHLLMIIDYDFRKGISLWGWVTPSLKWGCYH